MIKKEKNAFTKHRIMGMLSMYIKSDNAFKGEGIDSEYIKEYLSLLSIHQYCVSENTRNTTLFNILVPLGISWFPDRPVNNHMLMETGYFYGLFLDIVHNNAVNILKIRRVGPSLISSMKEHNIKLGIPAELFA